VGTFAGLSELFPGSNQELGYGPDPRFRRGTLKPSSGELQMKRLLCRFLLTLETFEHAHSSLLSCVSWKRICKLGVYPENLPFGETDLSVKPKDVRLAV